MEVWLEDIREGMSNHGCDMKLGVCSKCFGYCGKAKRIDGMYVCRDCYRNEVEKKYVDHATK